MSKEQPHIPTYGDAREAAGINLEVGLEDLVGKPITVLEWTPEARTLPQTKQRTQGYLLQGELHESQDIFFVFVGAKVLCKELTALVPPFTTVIRRSGQTYRFS